MKQLFFILFLFGTFSLTAQKTGQKSDNLAAFKSPKTATKAVNQWFTARKIKPVKNAQLMDEKQFKTYLYKDSGLSKEQINFTLKEIGGISGLRAIRALVDADCTGQPLGEYVIIGGGRYNQTERVFVLTACGRLRCALGYYGVDDQDKCEAYLAKIPRTDQEPCTANRCNRATYWPGCIIWINYDNACEGSNCNVDEDCR